MRITVAIKTKNKPAPPVTEPLLTTPDALKLRGQNELYNNLSVTEEQHEIPYFAPIDPLSIVQSTDHELGSVSVGRCTSSTIFASGEVVTETITMEIPEDA